MPTPNSSKVSRQVKSTVLFALLLSKYAAAAPTSQPNEFSADESTDDLTTTESPHTTPRTTTMSTLPPTRPSTTMSTVPPTRPSTRTTTRTTTRSTTHRPYTTTTHQPVPTRFQAAEAANQLLKELVAAKRIYSARPIEDKDFISSAHCRPGKIEGRFGFHIMADKRDRRSHHIWWLGDSTNVKALLTFLKRKFNRGLGRPSEANKRDLAILEAYYAGTKLIAHPGILCTEKDLKPKKDKDLTTTSKPNSTKRPRRELTAEQPAMTTHFESSRRQANTVSLAKQHNTHQPRLKRG